MEDARLWAHEEQLWQGGEDVYRALIDPACVMILPTDPFVFAGEAAIRTVAATPHWQSVAFADQRIQRPQEGLLTCAYAVTAQGGAHDKAYEAWCTTTWRRLGHDEWRVVQHQQSAKGVPVGDPAAT
jgi:hypothetical protein